MYDFVDRDSFIGIMPFFSKVSGLPGKNTCNNAFETN